ncbi:hypothetical protein GF312_12855 [Candidatus Poribacteria bacterium]|nr:hypothetical protein [Candidatus Poribacteria bacterium]
MPKTKPAFSIKNGDEISLSDSALTELLRSILKRGLPFKFCAKGTSMHPFIRGGDVITVSPLIDKTPGIGNVVAFTHPKNNKLMVHRIYGKTPKGYKIKGDNITVSDGIIPDDYILGYVTGIERNAKSISLGLGLERYLIAFFTRKGRLYRLFLPTWRLIQFIKNIIRWR